MTVCFVSKGHQTVINPLWEIASFLDFAGMVFGFGHFLFKYETGALLESFSLFWISEGKHTEPSTFLGFQMPRLETNLEYIYIYVMVGYICDWSPIGGNLAGAQPLRQSRGEAQRIARPRPDPFFSAEAFQLNRCQQTLRLRSLQDT